MPIDVILTLPDGREERLRQSMEWDVSLYRSFGRDDPLGTWTVRAEQGDRLAETTFELEAATERRVHVVPISTEMYHYALYPMVAPGESHHVLFTGFDGGEEIETRLYAGDRTGALDFMEPFPVTMDADGSALLTIPTKPSDRDRVFCLALEPELERRLYPGGTPEDYGSLFCSFHPFTTQFATLAALSVYCDASTCGFVGDLASEWRVVGVAPDDPDGGLNVRAEPRQALGNVIAVLRWDAAGITVEEQQGEWSAVSLEGWTDDAFLEPDPLSVCPPGLTSLRVTRVAPDDPEGGLVVGSEPSDGPKSVTAVFKWNSTGICGAENTNGEGCRQVLVSGWVGSRFIVQDDQ